MTRTFSPRGLYVATLLLSLTYSCQQPTDLTPAPQTQWGAGEDDARALGVAPSTPTGLSSLTVYQLRLYTNGKNYTFSNQIPVTPPFALASSSVQINLDYYHNTGISVYAPIYLFDSAKPAQFIQIGLIQYTSVKSPFRPTTGSNYTTLTLPKTVPTNLKGVVLRMSVGYPDMTGKVLPQSFVLTY